ncbi:Flp family type IVb pilin [Photobacterium atrarenae]|uniref:Flp family type IVb pilin n=1 Tax=Photobacterium atrarenae TaxID=865757 RepID=A0ABY5GH43_9GAMM|nr:hypothetical protein [Photobacterium atrarenae]UTV28598.1 hypothetical protein NNL38_04960 [Photobacterium atrarenae]
MDVSNDILKAFCNICARLYKEEQGASAIEYVLIAAVVVAAVSTLSGTITTNITSVGTSLTNAVSAATP